MKKLLTLSTAALALVAVNGLQQKGANECERKEREEKAEKIRAYEKAAAESRKHRRIHLVDLNDRKQLREYEDDGLYINIGDEIFVTGV